MLRVNFKSYGNYIVDSLYQWDKNQVLEIEGLALEVIPEIHFSNLNMRRSIVKQATIEDEIIKADIPNSLLQQPLFITAYIGIYEGEKFNTIETVIIPVIPRTKPEDYVLENDEEVYSFVKLENELANKVTYQEFNDSNERITTDLNQKINDETSSRKTAVSNLSSELKQEIDVERNRITNLSKLEQGSTTGDAELQDIRVGYDGAEYENAGEAVREQVSSLKEDLGNMTSAVGIFLNNLKRYNAFITSDGTWSTNETGISQCVFVPVNSGDSLHLEHSGKTTCHIAFINEFKTPVNGESASFASDYTSRIVLQNSQLSYDAIIPSDCNFVYVLVTNNHSKDYCPTCFKINKYDITKETQKNIESILLHMSPEKAVYVSDTL